MSETATEIVMRVLRDQRINCTGLGEVGCRSVDGWHSWAEHEQHQAETILAALTPVVPAQPSAEEGS